MPNHARTEVFPSPIGSQTTPILGAKFRLVGLLKKAPPVLGVASVRLTSGATLPFCSDTGVDVSWRMPSVTVRFLRERMASGPEAPNMSLRKPRAPLVPGKSEVKSAGLLVNRSCTEL